MDYTISVKISATTPNSSIITTTTQKVKTIEAYYIYAVVGIPGVLANLFILAVLFTDKKLLKQSAAIFSIATSHLLCAISIAGNGLYRVINFAHIADELSPWWCVARIYPITIVIAFQGMGFTLSAVGIERLAVFLFPHWYRSAWTDKRWWQIVGIGYMFAFISFFVGIYTVSYQPVTSKNCQYGGTFSTDFMVYCSTVSAVGGLIGVGLTLLSLILGIRHVKTLPLISGEAGRYKKQLKLSQSMISIAICDLFLVVAPNLLYAVYKVNKNAFPTFSNGNLSNVTNIMNCTNTLMAIGPYLIFHAALRKSAMEFLLCKRKKFAGPGVHTKAGPSNFTRVVAAQQKVSS